MARRLDRPPEGLDAYFSDVWMSAVKTQKAQGTWGPDKRVHTDEYVLALHAAKVAREEGKGAEWDRCYTRASRIATLLLLTEASRKAAGVGVDDVPDLDEFEKLDELAPRAARA